MQKKERRRVYEKKEIIAEYRQQAKNLVHGDRKDNYKVKRNGVNYKKEY